MKTLINKVALVTSATRGIGFATALKLAEEGAVVYLGVRRIEATQEICNEYPELKMIPVYFDAYKEDTYKTMIDEVVNKEGRIDILVNNFGVGKPSVDLDVVNSNVEDFLEIIKWNIGTVFSISKEVIPHMAKHGGGSIVNISSIGGSVADISRTGYGTSKASINHLTKQMAKQYGKDKIRCNAVLPGMIATDAVALNMPKDFIKSFLAEVPLNRIGKPEDIANAVAFFASDMSSYITGQLMEVAGAYGLGTPLYGTFVGKDVVDNTFNK